MVEQIWKTFRSVTECSVCIGTHSEFVFVSLQTGAAFSRSVPVTQRRHKTWSWMFSCVHMWRSRNTRLKSTNSQWSIRINQTSWTTDQMKPHWNQLQHENYRESSHRHFYYDLKNRCPGHVTRSAFSHVPHQERRRNLRSRAATNSRLINQSINQWVDKRKLVANYFKNQWMISVIF